MSSNFVSLHNVTATANAMACDIVCPATSFESPGNADRNVSPSSASQPPRRKANKLWTVCIFILFVEMSERLCYYTIAGTQRNFLEAAGPSPMDQPGAVSISASFSLLSYVSCILGGYLADNILGRYKTILYFTFVYVVGVVLIAISAYPSIMASGAAPILFNIGSLVLVALGTGAIKPNVMNFGAEQYDANDPVELEQQSSFFSYFYLTINLGCVITFGFVVNLATGDSSQGKIGWGYFEAYLIAAVCMILSLLAFLAGTKRYAATGGVTRTPMLSKVRNHLVYAAKQNLKGKLSVLGWVLVPIYMIVVVVGSLVNAMPDVAAILLWVALGLAMLSCGLLIVVHRSNDFIVELPGSVHLTLDTVTLEDVKGAMACMPEILAINVGFNIPYNAMSNAFPAQACQMDTRIGGVQLNGSFFSLGDAIAIILLVPVFEQFIYPFLAKRRGGVPVSRWAKYTAGFALAIIANGVGVIIEQIRRGMSQGPDPSFVACPKDLWDVVGKCTTCTGTDPPGCKRYLLSQCSPNASLPMTDMSAWWTFLPMFLIGAGEILVNPVIYQYVFDEAPSKLRSMVQAMNLVAAGAISNVFTAALGPLVPTDFNEGFLVYYFYVNIALATILLIGYWLLACATKQQEREVGVSSVPDSIEAAEVAPTSFASRSFVESYLATVDHGSTMVSFRDKTVVLSQSASFPLNRVRALSVKTPTQPLTFT